MREAALLLLILRALLIAITRGTLLPAIACHIALRHYHAAHYTKMKPPSAMLRYAIISFIIADMLPLRRLYAIISIIARYASARHAYAYYYVLFSFRHIFWYWCLIRCFHWYFRLYWWWPLRWCWYWCWWYYYDMMLRHALCGAARALLMSDATIWWLLLIIAADDAARYDADITDFSCRFSGWWCHYALRACATCTFTWCHIIMSLRWYYAFRLRCYAAMPCQRYAMRWLLLLLLLTLRWWWLRVIIYYFRADIITPPRFIAAAITREDYIIFAILFCPILYYFIDILWRCRLFS